MGRKVKITSEDIDAVLDILNDMMSDEEAEPQTWDDHEKAVNSANKEKTSVGLDLLDGTLEEKMEVILHLNLDKLILGGTTFENAQEMLQTVATLHAFNELKGKSDG